MLTFYFVRDGFVVERPQPLVVVLPDVAFLAQRRPEEKFVRRFPGREAKMDTDRRRLAAKCRALADVSQPPLRAELLRWATEYESMAAAEMLAMSGQKPRRSNQGERASSATAEHVYRLSPFLMPAS